MVREVIGREARKGSGILSSAVGKNLWAESLHTVVPIQENCKSEQWWGTVLTLLLQ